MSLPQYGEYLVIQLDPVASVEQLNDPEATKAAQHVVTHKYLVCVIAWLGIPIPGHPFPFSVAFVYNELTPDPDASTFHLAEMVLPIAPNNALPNGREPMPTEPEFPWPNCFQYTRATYKVQVLYNDHDTTNEDERKPFELIETPRFNRVASMDSTWASHLRDGTLKIEDGDPNEHWPVDHVRPPVMRKIPAPAADATCSDGEEDGDEAEAVSDAESEDYESSEMPDTESESDLLDVLTSTKNLMEETDLDERKSNKTASVRSVNPNSDYVPINHPFITFTKDIESISITDIGNPWDFGEEVKALRLIEAEHEIRVQEQIKTAANLDATFDAVAGDSLLRVANPVPNSDGPILTTHPAMSIRVDPEVAELQAGLIAETENSHRDATTPMKDIFRRMRALLYRLRRS